MKKIVVFFTGLLFFSTPVFAQKLGSSANPNPTGSAGGFAVYTPQEIQQFEEAGQDETVSVQNAGGRESGRRMRRRPNFWVLSGGQPTLKEEDEIYGSLNDNSEQNFAKETNKRDAHSESKHEKAAVMQTENSSASRQAAGSSSVASRMQELATSTPSNNQTNAAVGQENENVQGADAADPENEADDSAEEDTLVCRKYEKCAICERQKPFWNGRECASARKIAKMKKRDKAQAAQNRNRNNNGARGNAVSERAEENSSANANNASAEQGQNVQGNDAGTQQQDPTLNPDGTPKTKRQLRREQREARKAAAKNKK